MPYYKSSLEWLAHSTELLHARPETTRVTTKYHISPHPSLAKTHTRPSTSKARSKPKQKSGATTSNNATSMPKVAKTAPATAVAPGEADGAAGSSMQRSTAPRASIVMKTYDPVSGACLKYRTTRQQEVGRLVQALAKVAHDMCEVVATAAGAATDLKMTEDVADEGVGDVLNKNAEGSGSGSGEVGRGDNKEVGEKEKGKEQITLVKSGTENAGGGGGKKKKKGKK